MPDSYWGIPVDMTQMSSDTAKFMDYIFEADQRRFKKLTRSYSKEYVVKLWAYWATAVVALRKMTDPIESGMTLDQSDEDTLTTIFAAYAPQHQSPLPAVEYASMMLSHVKAVVDERYEDVALPISLWWETQMWDSLHEYMWAMGNAFFHFVKSSYVHSVAIMRAAMLRVMIVKAVQVLKKHEWCGDDLPMALNMADLLDDRRQLPPGDNWI